MKILAPHKLVGTSAVARRRASLVLVVLIVLVSSVATEPSAAYYRAGQHDFWGTAGCYPGYGTTDGLPRIVAWPNLMQRTPGFLTQAVYGGGGPAYGTTMTITTQYSAQWLLFRALVGYFDATGVFRQVPAYWLGGYDSLGSQTSGISSWVYYGNRWEKTTLSNVPGGIEDWSFVRAQPGRRYHIRFEYRWGPITATQNGWNWTAYRGDRAVVDYGWVQC